MSTKRVGPYLIKGVLGRGGMGTVYRGVIADESADNPRDQEVAVKVLSTAYADDPQFRSRFESEIQTLLQLDHPNIVRLIAHGEEDGNLFFAMELVEGESLHALQRSGKKFSWQEVIGIAMDVCAGLQHAHYRGIVHRDIKPANLILTKAGTTKITDFGIARLFGAERLTMHGGAIGTADFMSPEQAQGKIVTERSDLFSLGCVMYALLAGRPPFADKNVQATINRLNQQEPVPLRKLSPETPGEFADLISRLLQKRPEDRFGTAQALNRRLVDLLELIKAEADAQTAVAFELDDDSDEYHLSPAEQTMESKARTSKLERGATMAESDQEVVYETANTVIEDEKTDYFKVVDRKKKSTIAEAESHTEGPIWPYVAGMVAVLGLIVWGLVVTIYSQLNADELYDKIVSNELPQKKECNEFLERFPEDERARMVKLILAEIESRKLERKLTLAKKIRGIRSMYPIEVMLLDAVEARKDNPVVARNRLDSLIDLYEGDEELTVKEQEALSVASFFRTRVNEQAEIFIEKHRTDGLRAIERVKDAISKDDHERARKIVEGIIANFAQHRWAADIVKQANQLSANLPAASLEKKAAPPE